MSLLALWIIVILLFAIGLAGIFIPFVPGIGLVFLGVLVYALATHFATISQTTVIVLGIVALLAWLSEYIGWLLGARLGGGKRYAALGSIAGGVLGAIVGGGAPGLVVGAMIGAVIGALYEGNSFRQSARIALVSLIGSLAATFVQFLIAVSIIIAFIIAIAF